MSEPSQDSASLEPPMLESDQPEEPRRKRWPLMIGAIVVVIAGLAVGAWWAITNYTVSNADYDTQTAELEVTRTDLENARSEIAALQQNSREQEARIEDLESESTDLADRLSGREAELSDLEAVHGQLEMEHAQLGDDHTGLLAAHEALTGSIEGAVDDLETLQMFATFNAADGIVTDPSVVRRLSDPVIELRDELAQLVGWFETAEDYDFQQTRAFTRYNQTIERLGYPDITSAYQEFWDSAPGSQAELDFLIEFHLRMRIESLSLVNNALEAAEAALAALPD